MLKIKNIINQFIETRQHLKLLSIFFLSTLLFKVLILYIEIFCKVPHWNEDTVVPNSYLTYDAYWSDIVKIFLTIALFSFFIFLIFHIKKTNNKKYIFLFLSLLCLFYVLSSGISLFPIFEFGQAPNNIEILITVFVALAICYLFYEKMNKLNIFESKRLDEEKLKEYIVRYWPLYFVFYVLLYSLISYNSGFLSSIIFLLLGSPLSMFIWYFDSKILKFLITKKYFMERIWIFFFMPFVYVIHLYLFVPVVIIGFLSHLFYLNFSKQKQKKLNASD